MKYFLYCGSTEEGGMSDALYVFYPDEPASFTLTGWMSQDFQKFDEKLVEWADTAHVGEFFQHRGGVCIRVVDPDDDGKAAKPSPLPMPSQEELDHALYWAGSDPDAERTVEALILLAGLNI